LLSPEKPTQKTFGSTEEPETQKASGSQDASDGQDDDEWDSNQYDMTMMTSWRAFTQMKGAVFDNRSIWMCMLNAMIVAVIVAISIHFAVDLSFLNPTRVQKLSTFLNVFVGLLLGFFLSSSVNRWFGCVNAFLCLLDAVRNLQMQMVALGVSNERIEMLSRYGILSAWLLHLSLNISSQNQEFAEPEGPLSKVWKSLPLPKVPLLSLSSQKTEGQESPESEGKMRKMWKSLPFMSHETQKSETTIEKVWKALEKARPHLVLPSEKERLVHHQECYALLWTWVASLIGRMAQNGEIPPMASPTYGRIIEIVEAAYGSIRDVRTLQLVKVPFVYVHTLSTLVHVNNILNALGFGLVLGMTSQAVFSNDHDVRSFAAHVAEHLSSLFMTFCMSMVAPFLYLALLDVCVSISQPFTYQDSKIPALEFIRNLEQDITNATEMANNVKWEKPRFKK